MKQKIFTQYDIMRNRLFETFVKLECWNLLGMHVTKKIEYYQDVVTGNYIFNYL